jgi:hypothetical protein
MMHFRILLLLLAVLFTLSSARTVSWNPSCSSDHLSENCWGGPTPTIFDDVVFPAGTQASFFLNTNFLPYWPILGKTLTIAAGAEVTMYNGMLAVEDAINVDGKLTFLAQLMGTGPLDDGYEHPPTLPRYATPGFTPNIIGQKPSSKTVLTITGVVNMGCDPSAQYNGMYCYPSLFVDVVVQPQGTLNIQVAWLWGTVRNYGTLNAQWLYIFENGWLINEVSGQMELAALYCGNFTNFGVVNNQISSHDRVVHSIVNYGTMTYNESGSTVKPHPTGLPGEFVFAEPVENKGKLILATRHIRCNRFLFESSLTNTGELLVVDSGMATKSHLTNMKGGSLNASSAKPRMHVVMVEGNVVNHGEVVVSGMDLLVKGSITNQGSLKTLQAHQVTFRDGLRNLGVLEVNHAGTNVVDVDGDVVNQGHLDIGAAHTTFRQNLLNEGKLLIADTQPKRTRCFVEGRTYNTGNITLTHAHLTVTSILQHGTSHIDLSTLSSTLTLGAWGTSLQRGVDRGYLRREVTSPSQEDTCGGVVAEELTAASDSAPPSCSNSCPPDSQLCMIYADVPYCSGYQTEFEGQGYWPPEGRFMLAASTVAAMPSAMGHALANAKFQHPHAFLGDVRISGPGALTTTDTVEVQGHVSVENGAEVFSMVERAKLIAAGAGKVTLRGCTRWLLGNDGMFSAASPNVTVARGAALVVPRHADVQLAAGRIDVEKDGRFHVDGTLSMGSRLVLNVPEGFAISGRGAAKEADA